MTLTSGQPYITADLDLATRGTIGTGSCSGCSSTACLVFNSVTLKRLPGASVTDILISDPASSANWAFWQGTVGVDCAAVPVRNHTWGALKSLYR